MSFFILKNQTHHAQIQNSKSIDRTRHKIGKIGKRNPRREVESAPKTPEEIKTRTRTKSQVSYQIAFLTGSSSALSS